MEAKASRLANLGDILGHLETFGTDLVARTAPWLSPMPTAYLTARATVQHLAWPVLIGVAAGVIVECLGLAATATALDLREYNQGKRKSDPRAPFGLAVVLVGVYFGSVTLLTVLLDTLPDLATFAPLAFPVLSLAGVTTLALRSDHRRRLAAIAIDKQRRSAARRMRKEAREASTMSSKTLSRTSVDVLDSLNERKQQRKQKLLEEMLGLYQANPTAGPSEVSLQLGISRSTVYTYQGELQRSGRIRKNGNSVEVVER